MKRLLFLILLAGQFNAAGQARDGQNSGDLASTKAPVSSPSGQFDYQADLFTGRFNYRVDLPLAPARHGSQPSLTLGYNNAGDNGWCGMGWSLDLGYIQRETKHGVPVLWSGGRPSSAYDDAKSFVFSLNGKGSTLVQVSSTEYRAEIEGSFLRFQINTGQNQWLVTDTSGNKYYFGSTSAGRMSNPKTGWSSSAWSGTFRWALTRVETVQGDTIDYDYTTVSGALYPLKISYNGHTTGLADTHTVDFVLGNRSDVTCSYISGYRVEQNKRLDAIVHKVSGMIVWSNRLSYAQSPSTQRTLLQSVARFGTNMTLSLPPVVFGYSTQQFGFQAPVNWTNVSIPTVGGFNPGSPDYSWVSAADSLGEQFADLLDMDGDGLPDRVFMTNSSPRTNIWVQHNNGTGFDNPVLFGKLSVQNYTDSFVQVTSSNDFKWVALNAQYVRLLDINGDGYPDRVTDPIESLSPTNNNAYKRLAVQLNAGSNFLSSADTPWTNVLYENHASGTPPDPAISDYRVVERSSPFPQVTMIDVNGDGLPDRVMGRLYGSGSTLSIYTNYWVQFNTNAGFTGTNLLSFPWYDLASGNPTEQIYGATLNGKNVRLIDINGDGLPDRVMYPTNSATGAPEPICANVTYYVVEFGNGYGFEPPVTFSGISGHYLNSPCNTSDDCASIVQGNAGLQDAQDFALRDLNGDGLPDRIIRYQQCGSYTNWLVQFNLGTNFAQPVLIGPYYSQNQTGNTEFTAIQGNYGRLIDINGDGIPDHVMPAYPISTHNYLVVELGKGSHRDLLTVVSNGVGGSVNLTYQLSTKCDNRESTTSPLRHNLLPFPVYTVSSMSVSDGINPGNTTSYYYEGGKWGAARREFDGFAKVTVVDPLNLTNIHWFHQAGGRDNTVYGEYQDTTNAIGKKGIAFRIDTIGSNGQPYKMVLNKVLDADLGSGRHFAYVNQTMTVDYPGSSSGYAATAEQFGYDLSNGNLTNKIDFGEVYPIVINGQTFTDVSGDTVYHFTQFASLANTYILDKPQREILTTDNGGQNVLRETLSDYDGQTGNLLQQRDRICSDSYATTSYVTNSYGYNSYNNRTSATDEAGIVTSTVFDSTYQAYPAVQITGNTVTNKTLTDPRTGKVLLSTNSGGWVTANSYDPFLRVVETDVSTTANGSPSQWMARYDYRLGMANGLSTNCVHVRHSDGVDSVNGHETWTYSDGLGRVVQVRDESEVNGFRVTDTVYDERGNVQFVTLPRFVSGTDFIKPSGTFLGTFTEFDPIGRPIKATAAVNGAFNASGQLTGTTATSGDANSPVGPAQIAYNDGNDPWTLVITDEESKVHKYSLDAYGRTNQIVEVTGSGNYTTTLQYNLAGDLTNIIDNAQNQIQYAYNDLGQMVAMADPDMGFWQYRRDFAGRLREQVDAQGNLVRFNYNDPMGRLKSRVVYDPQGVFVYGVTNFYDTSDDANFPVYPGLLYKTTDSEGWSKTGYDIRERVIKTARYLSLNGSVYTNQFGYDDMDRVTQNVYPNGGPTVNYTYDAGTHLSQVRQVGGSGTVFYSAQGYDALAHLTGISFGNGVSTTYGYYSNSKRLQAIASSGVQNLSYTYDRVSNVRSVGDAGGYSGKASAALSSIVYDDLHRLTSLSRPGSGESAAFNYDSVGNMTQNTENGTSTYGFGVRMPHAVKTANTNHYAYDANGNMIVRDKQRLDYDPENRLTSVTTASSMTTFGYDAGGVRLWKQGTNSLQVWIGGNYEEKDGKILYHILAGDRLVCTFDNSNTVVEYYHPDHLHSTAVQTGQNGARIQHYEYTAFGQDRYTESTTAFPVSRRYTGQVKDEDTGLYCYGARYYDPQIGRFIQPDSVISDIFNPQSYNRYSYVLNNPLKHRDPTGKSAENVWVNVTVPAGVISYSPANTFSPNFSTSLQVNPSISFAQATTASSSGPTLSQGNPNAPMYAPTQTQSPATYDALLTGANHLVGTPAGETIAGMNADVYNALTPGIEVVAGKVGSVVGGTLRTERAAQSAVRTALMKEGAALEKVAHYQKAVAKAEANMKKATEQMRYAESKSGRKTLAYQSATEQWRAAQAEQQAAQLALEQAKLERMRAAAAAAAAAK